VDENAKQGTISSTLEYSSRRSMMIPPAINALMTIQNEMEMVVKVRHTCEHQKKKIMSVPQMIDDH
jgi:hypothetical protein